MLVTALASAVAGLLAFGPLEDLPLLPPAPPPQSPPQGPGGGEGRPDGDGFPDVGSARFADSGRGKARELWGETYCQVSSRVSNVPKGGDPHGPAGGGGADGAYRRLLVRDGDDVFGERCELGLNDHPTSPVALYREQERLITYVSLRPNKRFPVGRPRWQVVMQMKQSQPSDNGGGIPALALNLYRNRWRLTNQQNELWSAKAETQTWTRFAFDVLYSDSPDVGFIRVSADLNGDGDALDPGERSERIRTATLKTEGPGTDADGVPEGTAIPSHLRVGIYHDPIYACERSRCSIGVDNVGVYEPD